MKSELLQFVCTLFS